MQDDSIVKNGRCAECRSTIKEHKLFPFGLRYLIPIPMTAKWVSETSEAYGPVLDVRTCYEFKTIFEPDLFYSIPRP